MACGWASMACWYCQFLDVPGLFWGHSKLCMLALWAACLPWMKPSLEKSHVALRAGRRCRRTSWCSPCIIGLRCWVELVVPGTWASCKLSCKLHQIIKLQHPAVMLMIMPIGSRSTSTISILCFSELICFQNGYGSMICPHLCRASCSSVYDSLCVYSYWLMFMSFFSKLSLSFPQINKTRFCDKLVPPCSPLTALIPWGSITPTETLPSNLAAEKAHFSLEVPPTLSELLDEWLFRHLAVGSTRSTT